MPHATIATTQAKYTLEQLHAELAGKLIDNKREAKRLADCSVGLSAIKDFENGNRTPIANNLAAIQRA